jgi:hypothetical protein
MNKKSILSLCLFWPLISFGVSLNGENIPVNNKRDMNKVYRKIGSMILEGKFRMTASILAKAYSEYASCNGGSNIKKI